MYRGALYCLCFLITFQVALPFSLNAQVNIEKEINKELLKSPWPAEWITHPTAAPNAFGVYHFRKQIDLISTPQNFIVHISGDNKFRLFINGERVLEGPSRGDLLHYRFTTIDLAPFLKSGKNTIAAVVWNFGEHKALSQISNRTAFILQGNGEAEMIINTDDSWKVIQNSAYEPIPFGPIAFHGYYVVGPGERINASMHLWDWEKPDFDHQAWVKAMKLGRGTPQGLNSHENWILVQDQLPDMENLSQRFNSVRRVAGGKVSDQFIHGKAVQVPANSKVSIILDQGKNTVAFPELIVSNGKGSKIKLTYGESLFDDKYRKGNRNEVEGKKIFGTYDLIAHDGNSNRFYSTLYYRTFRYIELEIETGSEPLIINDFKSRFTAYPFKENGRFLSDDPMLKKIWDIGWHTARLCAYDTYMDTPYYEQLQYVADTRIQALISLYVSGDDRLMRNAIEQLRDSQVAEGITQSRYPTELPQFIPNFSLFWISMLHDFWMYREDDLFLKQFLPNMRSILSWWENKVTDKDMIPLLPYWDFTDHTYKTTQIAAAGRGEEGITPNTLQFAYTLRQAADLFNYFGENYDADKYTKLADRLVAGTYNHTYDPERKIFADTPAKKSYSQHANIFAVLTNAVPKDQQPELLEKIVTLPDLVQQTIYFQFYLFQAFKEAGVPDRYLDNLGSWKKSVEMGFTTFPEEGPEKSRSDCHAWSASPNYDFLATVCGIRPSSPGFKTVQIAPALGHLREVVGSMPHPLGEIVVKLKKDRAGISGEVNLPDGLNGVFLWEGKTVELKEGSNKIKYQPIAVEGGRKKR
jgi:alpha-L-rhamnosidase